MAEGLPPKIKSAGKLPEKAFFIAEKKFIYLERLFQKKNSVTSNPTASQRRRQIVFESRKSIKTRNRKLPDSALHTRCPLNFFVFFPEKKTAAQAGRLGLKSENNCAAKTSVQLIYASVSN